MEKRTSPNGIATKDLVFSAHIGTNDELFPNILKLYVKVGSRVADVTYGKGVFWRKVDTSIYEFLPSVPDFTSIITFQLVSPVRNLTPCLAGLFYVIIFL